MDEGESPDQAVTRELEEEVGRCGVTIQPSDYVYTSSSQTTKFCLHLYAKEISMDRFKEIERGCTQAKDWGSEVKFWKGASDWGPEERDAHRGEFGRGPAMR